jgi:hypothetical protein
VRAFWRNSGPENQNSSLNTFVMVHAHTPSAVDVLIGHMPFTDFSIYAYLNAFVRKMRSNDYLLRQIIFHIIK